MICVANPFSDVTRRGEGLLGHRYVPIAVAGTVALLAIIVKFTQLGLLGNTLSLQKFIGVFIIIITMR